MMINTTRSGDFQPQTGSQITCRSNENNYNSRRIERYLVETRGNHSSSTQPYVSEPIRCPPSPLSDEEFYEQQMSIEQSTEYYNARTWNMYHRIVQHCRKQGDNKSSCSASFLSSRKTCSNEKASSRGTEESLGNSNPGPGEIFHLEF